MPATSASASDFHREGRHISADLGEAAFADLLDHDEAASRDGERRVLAVELVGQRRNERRDPPRAGVNRAVAGRARELERGLSAHGIRGRQIGGVLHDGERDRRRRTRHRREVGVHRGRVVVGLCPRHDRVHEREAAVVDRGEEIDPRAAPKRRSRRGAGERAAGIDAVGGADAGVARRAGEAVTARRRHARAREERAAVIDRALFFQLGVRAVRARDEPREGESDLFHGP